MNFKKLVSITLVMLLGVSILSFGMDNMVKIEATLADYLNFEVDGEEWSPMDVDGSPLIPIIYNDRTYIPVRSLLEDRGVLVDWNPDTQTVILDYAASMPVDKSSPLLFEQLESSIMIGQNPNFEKKAPYTIDYEFNLEDDAMIMIDGRMMEGSLEEIAKMTDPIMMTSANMKINSETGRIESIDIINDDSQQSRAKIDIEIEISGPPFKIKITIRF